jgi:hypothetical protein
VGGGGRGKGLGEGSNHRTARIELQEFFQAFQAFLSASVCQLVCNAQMVGFNYVNFRLIRFNNASCNIAFG